MVTHTYADEVYVTGQVINACHHNILPCQTTPNSFITKCSSWSGFFQLICWVNRALLYCRGNTHLLYRNRNTSRFSESVCVYKIKTEIAYFLQKTDLFSQDLSVLWQDSEKVQSPYPNYCLEKLRETYIQCLYKVLSPPQSYNKVSWPIIWQECGSTPISFQSGEGAGPDSGIRFIVFNNSDSASPGRPLI